MKIGILTYWTSLENYGQILQLYALFTFLEKQGHDVFVIKYDGYWDKSLNKSRRIRVLNFLRRPWKLVTFIRNVYKQRVIKEDLLNHDCGFLQFKEKRLKWSKEYSTYAELLKYPPTADAYICGSDMIWVENGERYKSFFLGFGDDKIIRIAYAPSFGARSVKKSYLEKIKPYLSRFDLISTREESGRDLCLKMGFKDAYWFPDPTSLLSSEEYRSIEVFKNSKEKYCFLYLMGHSTDIPFSEIKEFADHRNLKIYYRASPGRRDKYDKLYPTIEEWLAYIDHADYVITNSFHGCMFSLIFNKKFLFLPLVKDAAPNNERIYSLLKRMHLENRIWRGDFLSIEQDIDYSLVNKRLESWVEDTKNILKQYLQ